MLSRKTQTILFSAVLTAVLPSAASAQPSQAASTTMANKLPRVDRQFVQAATMSNSTEIDAAKIARSRSKDDDVVSFAQHMTVDHAELTAALQIAAPHGIKTPKDNSDMALLDRLNHADPTDFDRLYVEQIGVEGHKTAIAAFQQEISHGQNDDLKHAAQKALPTLQQHYQMAQDLAKKKGFSPQS
jgi:putative membrane protein